MLKNILAVIGAVTVAAVAYVAFSDHVIVKIEPDEEGPEDPEKPEEPKEVAKPSEPKKEDHKLTFDELVRKMDKSEERLAEAEAAAAAKAGILITHTVTSYENLTATSVSFS